MFEILKALMALQQAAGNGRTHWKLVDDEHLGKMLTVEIPLTDEEFQFGRDMQAMFEPIPEGEI